MIITLEKLSNISKDSNFPLLSIIGMYGFYKGNDILINDFIANSSTTQIDELKAKGYIIDASKKLYNRMKIEHFFANYKNDDITTLNMTATIHNIESWIDTYRKLFSGLRDAKSMGTRSEVCTKMRNFIIKYPQYANVDLILEATKIGIELEIKRCGIGRVRQADYFISKLVTEGNMQTRKEDLAYYCEYIQSDEYKKKSTNQTKVKQHEAIC